VVELERAAIQPMVGAQGWIDGQWVSPQVVLGASGELARAEIPNEHPIELAPSSLQPASSSSAPKLAPDLDERVNPPMVKRYAEAEVVRFLAPREAIKNLFDEIGLDDLNRYQFRRNRPDNVPVERVTEGRAKAPFQR
jgi:hypothetical protein